MLGTRRRLVGSAQHNGNPAASNDSYFAGATLETIQVTPGSPWASAQAASSAATSLPSYAGWQGLAGSDAPAGTQLEIEMSGRDRTQEFASAVKMLKTSEAEAAATATSRTSALHQKTEFMRIARMIGKDISSTFGKLEKMTLLCKRKSLFDDKQPEIQELTYIIKQDLGGLNKQIAQLQQLAKSQKGKNGKHVQSHSNSVVLSLQSKLAAMSNDFKNVLEVRTENLKDQKTRREQFSSAPVQSSLPPSVIGGRSQGSVLMQDEMSSRRQGSSSTLAADFSINMDGVDGVVSNRASGGMSSQMQLVEEQDSYIQSRADTMKNIESTIVELGGIFQQLAHMVKEQEEVVHRIDSNVEDAHLNVEMAHSEILKYFQSVTNNRWLMIKVFGVLIVFFIIFIVFLA